MLLVLKVEWRLGLARVHLCSRGSPCRAASLSFGQIASEQRPETRSQLGGAGGQTDWGREGEPDLVCWKQFEVPWWVGYHIAF